MGLSQPATELYMHFFPTDRMVLGNNLSAGRERMRASVL